MSVFGVRRTRLSQVALTVIALISLVLTPTAGAQENPSGAEAADAPTTQTSTTTTAPAGEPEVQEQSSSTTIAPDDDPEPPQQTTTTSSTVVEPANPPEETPGSISGVVSGPAGPLEGATVRVSGPSATETTTTGTDGSYVVTDLEPGDHTVEFDPSTSVDPGLIGEFYDDKPDADSADAVSVTSGANVAGIDADLIASGSLTGTVTDANGPLGGVVVSATGTVGGGFAMTASDGTYAIENLAPGDYTVRFDPQSVSANLIAEYYDDALQKSGATPVTVATGAATPGIDAVIELGGSISGVVTGNGGPLGGVRVNSAGPTNQSVNVYTAADGSYTLSGLKSGSHRLHFEPAYGSDFVDEYFDDQVTLEDATPVSVFAGTDTSGTDADLAVGATISGNVAGPSGPVSGVLVESQLRPYGQYASTYTDASGDYTLVGLHAGPHEVHFDAQYSSRPDLVGEYWDDTLSSDAATPVVLDAGEARSGIDAVLVQGGSISGVVTDPSGPLQSAYVSAVPVSDPNASVSTWTAPDGSYTLNGLPEGSHKVRFVHPTDWNVSEYYDDAPDFLSAIPVAVVAGADTPGIDAELPDPASGGSISGTVTGPSGPVEGVLVRASGPTSGSTLSGPDGSYTIGSRSPGLYTVTFETRDSTQPLLAPEAYHDSPSVDGATPVNVATGTETSGIDAVLEPGGAISGTVTSDAGPVAGVDVKVTGNGWGPWHTGFQTATGEDGGYILAGLPTGTFEVCFETRFSWYPDLLDDCESSVTVVGGVETSGIDTHLQAGGSVSGTVTGPNGPVGGVEVSFLSSECCFFFPVSVTTSADGTYSARGLVPGEYRVQFDPSGSSEPGLLAEYYDGAPDYEGAVALVVGGGSERTGIDASLEIGGSMSGVVSGPNGPVAGVQVGASALDGYGYGSATTAADGSYTIPGLRSGDYYVSFTPNANPELLDEYFDDAHDYERATPVPVTAGDDTPGIDASLELGGSISGVVTGPNGPLGGAQVTVTRIECCIAQTVAAAPDGTYTVVGLPGGQYTVQFSDVWGGPHLMQYYDGAPDAASATSIDVTPGVDTPNIDATLQLGGSISGTVTDATGPVAGVVVWPYGEPYSPATTAADGTYTLQGLPPGDHVIQFTPPYGAPLVEEFYDDAYQSADATPITTSIGSVTTGIDALLDPGGTISGTVTGPSGPIAGATVTASPGSPTGMSFGFPSTGGRSTTTAADGTYTLRTLTPGDQFLSFADVPGGPHAPEFYDDTYDEASATPVPVTNGSTTNGIDASLELGGVISGTVSDSSGPLANVNVSVFGESIPGVQTAADGTYRLQGLHPGDYVIQFSPPYDAQLLAEFYDDVYESADATPITASIGSVTSGIDATLDPGGTITGTVTGPSGPLGGVSVTAEGTSTSDTSYGLQTEVIAYTTTAADGTYTLANVRPGDHVIRFEDYSGDHAREFYDGVHDRSSATPVTVANSTVTSGIDATMAVGGSISGTVTHASGPLPQVQVSVSLDGEWLSSTTTASDGTYTLGGLPPGDLIVTFDAWFTAGYPVEYYDNALDRAWATPIHTTLGVGTSGIDAELGPRRTTTSDFDGDGATDIAVFRPGGSAWFVQGGLTTGWGAAGDVPVSGDFNGDGSADVAVFRPADQTWYVQPSSTFPGGLATQWGIPGDIPVPADFNGDGVTDIAVFRPSDQTWYAQPSATFPGGLATQWGVTGDLPVPVDFDGDGADEVAVFRPSDQTWYSQSGLATQWGVTGDIPVPADFDGDGADEVAVFRPSDQTWYSQSGLATQWGAAGDMAVPGDYDGNGTTDVAVYRPSDQTWYVQGGLSTQWGATGDVPVIIPPAIRDLY